MEGKFYFNFISTQLNLNKLFVLSHLFQIVVSINMKYSQQSGTDVKEHTSCNRFCCVHNAWSNEYSKIIDYY